MAKPRVIVISDLHISAGPLDDCDQELESCLVGFFGELFQDNGSAELVINGDFLDFVQAPPWSGPELESESPQGIPLCFKEEHSLAKLEAIFGAHATVFESLREFLNANPQNKLVILPGNHDADFFWASVRSRFVELVCGKNAALPDRLRLHLEPVYRPPNFARVWIEHGHQYDETNSFFVSGNPCWSQENPPIFEDQEGQMRLYECVGTRLLIQFVNQLEVHYPFVDNIKPFSRFLRVFATSALVRGYGPLRASVTVWNMFGFLASRLRRRPSDVLSLEEEDRRHPRFLLLDAINRLAHSEQRAFSQKLEERGFPLDRPLAMVLEDAELAEPFLKFLATHLDLLESLPEADESYLSTAPEEGMLSLGKGFFKDETKELIGAARTIVQSDAAEAVIMGHTHETVKNPPALKYVNTGCWTRYYRFDGEEKLGSWRLLKSASYDTFPYQLNYAEIVPAHDTAVHLITYREKLS